MTIKTNSPQISVKLLKTSMRVWSGRMDAGAHIDLTPYLTEGSSVSTHKAINTPNGRFTIRLGDRLLSQFGDSIYNIVEPMDAVEIRMSRLGDPVMVMRGFVTDVLLDEGAGDGGRPTRNVMITGCDYSSFFRIIQIHFMKGTAITDLLLQISGQYMQEKFGVPYVSLTAGAYLIYLVAGVINPFIKKLGNPMLSELLVDVSGADPDDQVYPQGVQANPEGTMWSHIQKHGNIGPFYELFFDDKEAATTLVYRKPAYKKLVPDGGPEYIFPFTSAEKFTIPPDETVVIQRSRSDRDVANWYYVRAPRGDMLTPMDSVLESIVGDGSSLSKKDYKNCDETIYGFRSMESETQHGYFPNPLVSGQPKSEHESGVSGHVSYVKKQIKYLQDCNVDNVVFESGSIRCNGSPDYKPGRYCEITWRSGVKFTAYVTSVSHSFEPFRGYLCTLQYIRGTEFHARQSVGKPYFYGKGVYE